MHELYISSTWEPGSLGCLSGAQSVHRIRGLSQMQTGMQHIVSARSDDELRMLIRGLVSWLLARVGSIPLSSYGTKEKRKRSTSAYAQPSLSGDRHERQGQVILSTLSGLASFVLNVPLWTQRQNGNDMRNDWTGEVPDTVYDASGSKFGDSVPKTNPPTAHPMDLPGRF